MYKVVHNSFHPKSFVNDSVFNRDVKYFIELLSFRVLGIWKISYSEVQIRVNNSNLLIKLKERKYYFNSNLCL